MHILSFSYVEHGITYKELSCFYTMLQVSRNQEVWLLFYKATLLASWFYCLVNSKKNICSIYKFPKIYGHYFFDISNRINNINY